MVGFLSIGAIGLWAASAIASPVRARSEAITYEAEDAVLSGTTVDTAIAGFTGRANSIPNKSDWR